MTRRRSGFKGGHGSGQRRLKHELPALLAGWFCTERKKERVWFSTKMKQEKILKERKFCTNNNAPLNHKHSPFLPWWHLSLALEHLLTPTLFFINARSKKITVQLVISCIQVPVIHRCWQLAGIHLTFDWHAANYSVLQHSLDLTSLQSTVTSFLSKNNYFKHFTAFN